MLRANTVRTVAEDLEEGHDPTATRVTAPRESSQFANFHRAYVTALEPKWQKEVLSRMTALLRHRAGWDSYGAQAPRYDAAMFALTILQRVMRGDTPVPFIVPSHMGGVQLEWHENQIDLEIHIVEPYKGDIWWRDHATGRETLVDLSQDLSGLRAPIGMMSEAN
jgi:hypothetical protein